MALSAVASRCSTRVSGRGSSTPRSGRRSRSSRSPGGCRGTTRSWTTGEARSPAVGSAPAASWAPAWTAPRIAIVTPVSGFSPRRRLGGVGQQSVVPANRCLPQSRCSSAISRLIQSDSDPVQPPDILVSVRHWYFWSSGHCPDMYRSRSSYAASP